MPNLTTTALPRNMKLFCAFILFMPLLVAADEAWAIPPPEIARIGSTVAQVAGFFLVFFSTALFIMRRWLASALSRLSASGRGWAGWTALGAVIVGIPLLATVLVIRAQQRDAIAKIGAEKNRAQIAGSVMTVAGTEFDIGDPALKIGPREAAGLLNEKDSVFIDIREPVEFSIRRVPGFSNIRLGDLLAGGVYRTLAAKKRVIILCEAGERGAAVVVFLRLKGFQAWYVEGGIRAWREAALPFSGDGKMILPEFRNKNRVLTAAEAKRLIREAGGILIDVRAPAEFRKGHLAEAINIPLVNMPTPELETALGRIPQDSTAIGVSYDRFGAYYCRIIGYMLGRRAIPYGGTLLMKPADSSL